MPANKVPIEKEPVSFRLSADVLVLVDSLVGTIHGSSRTDVVRSLALDRLKEIFPTGRLPKDR
jgi:hypothetical protein